MLNYTLHKALSLAIDNEGLVARFERQSIQQNILKESIKKLGLNIFGDEEHEMPNMIAVEIPEKVDGEEIIRILLDDYGIEIASSFGPMSGKIWRIGLMGYVAQKHYVFRFLSIFVSVLEQNGQPVNTTLALNYAQKRYQDISKV